jgi:LPS export ABC transporter protein LptC
MPQRLIYIVGLTLLLSAAIMLLRDPRDATNGSAADSPLAQDYDYIITNMQMDSFTPDGTLQYHLVSGRVTHYPSPDHSVLDNPSLHWFEPGQPDWVLSARSGDLRTDGTTGHTRLLLQQDVLASRSAGDGATLDIRSDSLLLLPDAGELSTMDSIQLHNGNTRLASAGMQAWLRENRIKLSAGSGQHE